MASLLVTAHPDDETLFFGGLLLSQQSRSWHVVCVTDGNGEGRAAERTQEFSQACQELGVSKYSQINLPDTPNTRLDVQKIMDHLLSSRFHYERIYTHGIVGEYGHIHHQDVSFATHMAYAKHPHIYSLAYNTWPDEIVTLNSQTFSLKANILWKNYKKEVHRFVNVLPVHACEGYTRVSLQEVQAIYAFLAQNEELKTQNLKHYAWMAEYLKEGYLKKGLDMFLGNYFK